MTVALSVLSWPKLLPSDGRKLRARGGGRYVRDLYPVRAWHGLLAALVECPDRAHAEDTIQRYTDDTIRKLANEHGIVRPGLDDRPHGLDAKKLELARCAMILDSWHVALIVLPVAHGGRADPKGVTASMAELRIETVRHLQNFGLSQAEIAKGLGFDPAVVNRASRAARVS